MSKTVIVSGSARKQGTSSNLAEEIKRSIGNDCKIFSLAKENVLLCEACLYCDKDRKQNCVLKDDYKKFITIVEGSDNILFISPIYGGNITGRMKNFIDRTNHYFNFDKLEGKKMFLILTGCLPIIDEENPLFSNKKPIKRIQEFFEEYAGITGCDFEYLGYFKVHPDNENVFENYPEISNFIEKTKNKLI